ncbi:MAG TPA: FecR domain-containing protein [Haliscomenobacter sp.]|uniref:FecR family protein n=1 Tax=Haliscomenobacter sp. TaxID=2717303 RepID=UPI002B87CDBC|nr:FecR domain-containing protein [Haliscomenobacter sp.]HOY19043.1 FecR domain-containing protein [Haliscomenobacter sp.]
MKPETFTSYSALDFAQEPSFIRWVRAGDEEAAVFWQNWLDQHPEKASAVAEGRKLAQALTVREEEPSEAVLNALWNRIDLATSTAKEPLVQTTPTVAPTLLREAKIRPLRRWLSYAAAACVTLLLLALLYNPTERVSAGIGQKLTHQLPDGSSVAINAASSISYHPWRWRFTRQVELEGEAFFQVTKGSRFVVKAVQGQVEVLGTSFNVRARGNSFAVSCVTGKVRVSNPKGAQILTPGLITQTNENGDLVTPYTIDNQPSGAWRDGKFYFTQTPLEEVFAEIQRQFEVRIQTTPEIARRKVTTYFEGSNIDTALFNVCWPLRLETSTRGDLILIK